MKKIITVSLIILFFAGCESKKQIELLEDEDLIYLSVNQLDKQPVLNKSNKLADVFQQIFKEEWKGYAYMKETTLLAYTYYVGEDGKIQKVKRKQIGEKFGLNLPENYTKEIEPKILKELEYVKFEPAQKDGKDVKFKNLLMFSLSRNKENKIESMIYWGIGKQHESVLKNLYLNTESEFMIKVDVQPEPIGGIMAIQKNVRYPEDAKKKKIQGTVFIKAFIDENGTVTKTEVIRGTNSSLDTAASNAVKLTKFTPGKQAGIPVKTQVAVPIAFKLK